MLSTGGVRHEIALRPLDWQFRVMNANKNTQLYQFGPVRFMNIRMLNMPEKDTHWTRCGIGVFAQLGRFSTEFGFAPFFWKLYARRRDNRDAIALGPLRLAVYLVPVTFGKV